MRKYQEEIKKAVIQKGNWMGSNTIVTTRGDKHDTKVFFYGSMIAYVDHINKTAKYDNCGFNNTSTAARINAVKMAVEELGY